MNVRNDSIQIRPPGLAPLRYTPEQREALVEACQPSGLSTPRFVATHGVMYQMLSACIHRSTRMAKPPRPLLPVPAPLLFVPVEPEGLISSGVSRPMEIHLPGEAKLTITAPGQVQLTAALIHELANPQPC